VIGLTGAGVGAGTLPGDRGDGAEDEPGGADGDVESQHDPEEGHGVKKSPA